MVHISLCKKSDYKTLIQIEKSIFKHFISVNELKSFEMNESHVIWKIEKIKIIGFVYFFHVRDEIEIIKICIIKSHQRKNYGSILINEIKKLNIKKIFLEVSIENVNAINFYLKNGFQKIGVRKGYYANDKSSRIDALRFCAKL
jgi:ribosomal-protein-alanine N-acetyltransferase